MTARSFSWLSTGISMQSGGVNLVLLSQTPTLSEMMFSCKWFKHVNQMPTLSYMHANSIIIKNAIILNIKHNIFKLREINLIFGAFNTEYRSNLFLHFMRARVAQLPNNSFKPITNTAWIRARLCKLQKGWTRLAAANDKVYQLLAHGRWFSPGTPASSTTKTGRHDIAEILLKVTLKHQKSNQINLYILGA